MMNHVSQRNNKDCGIAVMAMLSDLDYEEAEHAIHDAFIPPGLYHAGITLENLRTSLMEKTNLYWEFTHHGGAALTECKLPTERCAVMIRRPRSVSDHWIAIEGRNIFDPELNEAVVCDDYQRRDWRTTWQLHINRSAYGEFYLNALRELNWL